MPSSLREITRTNRYAAVKTKTSQVRETPLFEPEVPYV